ncbi:MICOS complex subunit Mic10 isoform X3 [Austrofundulus limnaeus]|uniref:MICOS complex subunit MIC10 n=1 Tax=Austrofundulus limnaeus TaxID=52670 RepID=A0A2I4B225_AUSLI|nr:PREDICTED: MICOS complex subunit Mic10-like isoform X3 [Austrofundulus limnaeus]
MMPDYPGLNKMADDYGRKWDRCLADTAVKTVTGLSVGIVFSILLFKRKLNKGECGLCRSGQAWGWEWDTPTASMTSGPIMERRQQ